MGWLYTSKPTASTITEQKTETHGKNATHTFWKLQQLAVRPKYQDAKFTSVALSCLQFASDQPCDTLLARF